MNAILGTLPFIATLWLLVVLGAAVLEESGAKIAAALKGKPMQRPSASAAMRVRVRWRSAATRAESRWRAAA
jgi:predicted deacetylase